MASPIELPLELKGMDSVTAGVAKVEQQTAKAAANIQGQLKKAFAANVLVASLKQVEGHLDDTARAALNAGSTMAQGFLQGGPWGLAFTASTAMISEGIKTWKAYEEAGVEGARATAAAIGATRAAIATHTAAIETASEKIEAIAMARREGTSVEDALGIISRDKVAASIAASETMAAAAQRNIAAVDQRLRELEFNPTRAAEIERESLASQRRIFENTAATSAAAQEGLNASLKAMDATHLAGMVEQRRRAEESAAAAARAARAAAREAFAREEVAFFSKQAGDRAEAEVRAALELDARLRGIEDTRQQDAWDRELRQEADDRARMEREIADAAWLSEQIASQSRTAEESRRAAARETAQAIGEELQREIDQRRELDAAMMSAGEDVARNLFDMATAEGELSKAHFERIAKQSALEAAFNLATGFARLAFADGVGSTAAFIAAGKYAAIAGGAAIGAAVTPAAAESEPDRSGRGPSSGGGRGGSGGRGGEGAGVTVIMPAGQLFLTRADTSRAIADGVREAQRRA